MLSRIQESRTKNGFLSQLIETTVVSTTRSHSPTSGQKKHLKRADGGDTFVFWGVTILLPYARSGLRTHSTTVQSVQSVQFLSDRFFLFGGGQPVISMVDRFIPSAPPPVHAFVGSFFFKSCMGFVYHFTPSRSSLTSIGYMLTDALAISATTSRKDDEIDKKKKKDVLYRNSNHRIYVDWCVRYNNVLAAHIYMIV